MNIKYFLHPLRRLRGLRAYLRIFGISGLTYAIYSLVSSNKKLVQVSKDWAKYPVFVRLNSSDVLVFQQVFIDREYQVVTKIPGEMNVIVDAGANIGLTSVFLAELYPDAKILAIEPDLTNLKIMHLNVKHYENIECVTGALWKEDEPLNIASDNVADWAFRVTNKKIENDRTIMGYRLDSLMQKYGVTSISLLKMDIEGSEFEVMETCSHWIDDVTNIVTELHESIRPGCTNRFFECTGDFDTVATTRELTLVSRRRNPD